MESLVQNALQSAPKVDEMKVGEARISVIGFGGGGGNVASWLHKKGIQGAKVYVANTDKQHLDMCSADGKLLLGVESTRGLGAGGHPEVGREAARESLHDLKGLVKDADMVFLCAGLGGGTGSGSITVGAQLAKETGAIVIGTVTMPFEIERARVDKAEFALQQLREHCDTVIVIDNNRLVNIAGNLPVQQAFAVANELISTMIKAIVETIAVPSLVNLDYADVRAIMSSGQVSVIGIGESDTESRVDEATRRALTNPLLDVSYEGAQGALIHVTGGNDLLLDEVNRIGEIITEALDPEANCIWGARIDPQMSGRVRVMAIVTGVTSPYILGKTNASAKNATASPQEHFADDLGIDMVTY